MELRALPFTVQEPQQAFLIFNFLKHMSKDDGIDQLHFWSVGAIQLIVLALAEKTWWVTNYLVHAFDKRQKGGQMQARTHALDDKQLERSAEQL